MQILPASVRNALRTLSTQRPRGSRSHPKAALRPRVPANDPESGPSIHGVLVRTPKVYLDDQLT